MTVVSSSWNVVAGTAVDTELDVTGLTPDEVAALVYEQAETHVSVCHQCAYGISDPEVTDLTEIIYDGKVFTEVDGHWVEYKS